jgi:hypothetical protein
VVPLLPSLLEGLRAGSSSFHRSGGAMEGEEGARRADEGFCSPLQRRVRREASHSRLVRSNLSAGEICPYGSLQALRAFSLQIGPPDRFALWDSSKPLTGLALCVIHPLPQGGGDAGAEAPGRGVGEIIIKRRAAIGEKPDVMRGVWRWTGGRPTKDFHWGDRAGLSRTIPSGKSPVHDTGLPFTVVSYLVRQSLKSY